MFSTLNLIILIAVYIIFLAFVLAQHPHFKKNRGNDQDQGGDGGWDNADDTPPLDLPPGVFILPPDADDPSQKNLDKELWV